MKIVTPYNKVGRFFVGVKSQNTIELIGSASGFDTYEDAEAQLKKHRPTSLQHEFLILQAVGEFVVRPQYFEVHSS